MPMDQTQARRYAKEVGGVACTRDTYHGRFDKTFEWGVAIDNGFVTSFIDELPHTAAEFNTEPKLTAEQTREWRELDRARIDAGRAYEQDDSDANYAKRDAAFDAEADWIEANDLNYTVYDPRGLTND